MMQTLSAPLEVKASKSDGTFEGYGAVFNNRDLGDDIILPDAFEQVKTTTGGKLRIALNHDLRQIVAQADFSQDDHGLHIKGKMNLNVSYARDAYELMKDGSLDGLSVGFNILPDGERYEKDDNAQFGSVRIISKAELWETSIVPFGMNPEAKIDSVKDIAGMIQDVREFESFLRKSGFSRSQAVAIAAKGFKAVQSDSVGSDRVNLDAVFNYCQHTFSV